MNALYQIIYGLRRVELKPEVRLWKTEMKAFIPPWVEVEQRRLWIALDFHGNWETMAGKVRVVDLQNMVKVTVDVIAEKLKFNDSLIFEQRRLRKIQSDEKKIEVELGFL